MSSIASIQDELISEALRFVGDRFSRMRSATDLLWDRLGLDAGGPISWIGFYDIAGEGNEQGGVPGESMILSVHRDKPACSPIGLHGMCGKGFVERRSLIVNDVRKLGENYVACDPRDLSEIVVPMFSEDGTPWGVIDGDSFDVGAFTAADIDALRAFCEAAGLSTPGCEAGEPLSL